MLRHIMTLVLTLTLLLGACALGEEINDKVTHYLLLGEDGYAEEISDDARTDTIVIVSFDEKYNRVIMTSVLRDCQINNLKGNPTKLNLLYKTYGLDGVIACLERELDIDIEGAVLVNFENVKPVIDALGGVDIEIDAEEASAIRKILLNDDPNLPQGAGMTHMTGRIALAYMRIRYSIGGDFGRTERQRKVVSQLVEKCRSLSLFELVDVYNAVSEGMQISLSPMQILSAISKGYSMITHDADFTQYYIPQDGTFYYDSLNGSSVLNVRWSTNKTRFHDMLNNP